ncbi:MAG: hypothetical protein FWG45_07865, partial [Oscillospiraceae bacterium]|nr:hypothetical protein [Oscillospiraceae bacterium]
FIFVNNKTRRAKAKTAAVAPVPTKKLNPPLAQKAASVSKTKPPPLVNAVKYEAGERVKHKVFGEGFITEISDMGNDSLLEIAFDNVGTKKIMANFAKVEKI